MDVSDNNATSLKLCNLCNNVMMIDKTESDVAKWKCSLCSNSEDLVTATIISTIKKNTMNDSNNPRYMHETRSPLNQVLYKTCKSESCESHRLNRKACIRKVIYDDGYISYYCQDCLKL